MGLGLTVPAGEVTAATGSVSDHLAETAASPAGRRAREAVHSNLIITVVFGTGIKLENVFPLGLKSLSQF